MVAHGMAAQVGAPHKGHRQAAQCPSTATSLQKPLAVYIQTMLTYSFTALLGDSCVYSTSALQTLAVALGFCKESGRLQKARLA